MGWARFLSRLPGMLWVDVHPSHAGYFPNLVSLVTWVVLLVLMIGSLAFIVYLVLLA